MKHLLLSKRWFASLLLTLVTTLSWAYSFEVDGIYYNRNDDGTTVAVSNGSKTYSGDVIIPATVTYDVVYDVTSIGSEAFSGCSGLTSVTIPNSVTSIGLRAFSNCTGLTSINIPNSVTSIDASAFSGCTSLPVIDNIRYADTYLLEAVDETQSTYKIKEGTRFIDYNAFSGCSSLKSINIPASVINIGPNWGGIHAFHHCPSLKYISVDSNNKVFDSRNGCNAIVETASNILVAGCKNTVIPNSVTSIGEYAFYGCSGLTSISIPESVTSIANDAFNGCYDLTSISIPNSVTSIGSRTFTYCSGLTSITIPNSVTSIGESAFYDCSSLTSITIPNSVTSIGNDAFCNCSGLTSVTIPNSVKSIGYGTFWNCSGLTSVTIPESVTRIGESAFYGCSGLTSITIPNSVTSIGNDAFRNCSGLTSITIPEGVTSIDSEAFRNCPGLNSISVDAGNPVYDSRNNCNAIIKTSSNTLISGCKNTAIPNSVTSIGALAFLGCSGLTSISIPESVTSIGWYAFYGCSGLKKVTCLVKESDRRTEDLPVVPEPVKPSPGIEPNVNSASPEDQPEDLKALYLYPFNPAHPNDPTTANVEETVDVTIDNVYPADECRAKWLDYYKKVYNARNATVKQRTKWANLSHNPYIKRSDSKVTSLIEYVYEWQDYLQDYKDYEAYIVYKKYATVPVPETTRDAFEEVPLSDATLYVYEDVIDAYRVTFPWSEFGQILPIDPLAVEELKSDKDAAFDENAPIYDLMGRRLQQKPASGYYIQGGKKYFVK